MNEEERLALNNYVEDLYQAMQIGDIKFEAKHSYQLYNLINKLQQENKQLKEQLQQKEYIINKAKEYIINNSLYEEEYDYDYEENIYLSGTHDDDVRRILLEI